MLTGESVTLRPWFTKKASSLATEYVAVLPTKDPNIKGSSTRALATRPNVARSPETTQVLDRRIFRRELLAMAEGRCIYTTGLRNVVAVVAHIRLQIGMHYLSNSGSAIKYSDAEGKLTTRSIT